MATWNDQELSDFDKWVMKKRVEKANRVWAAKKFGSWIIAITMIITFFRLIARI